MSRTRLFSTRRVTIASLSLLAVAGCSQVIGLGAYKVGDNSDAGNSDSGSSTTAGGSSAAGGAASGSGGDTVVTMPDGGAGRPAKSDAGASSGGTGGEAGSPSGGASAGGAGGSGLGGAGVSGGGAGGTGVAGNGVGGSAGASGGAGGGSAGATSACPMGCNDNIPCTIDLCDTTGCVHTPVDNLCDGTCMKCDLQAGCVDHSTTTELLVNGTFDASPVTGWTQASSHTDSMGVNTTPDTLTLITAPPAGITAQSAPNVAALGLRNDEATWVYQPVTVPAQTVALTLTGSLYVKSTESMPGIDIAFIDMVTDTTNPNSTDSFLDTFSKVWGNEESGSGWVAFSENGDVTTIPPAQNVWIAVYAVDDPSLITSFYFDSLSLKAKVCSP